MTAPFISLEDLGFYVKQDLSASELAIMMIDASCQLIRDEINQFINYVEDDEVTLDGNDRSLLILLEHPIVEVTEVLVDDVVMDPANYRVVNERTMLERVDGDVWFSDTKVTITYSHGWAIIEAEVDPLAGIDRVPSSIRAIALDRAATGMVAGSTGVGGVRSETLGRYRYDMDTTAGASAGIVLTEEQCASLQKYMVEGVA